KLTDETKEETRVFSKRHGLELKLKLKPEKCIGLCRRLKLSKEQKYLYRQNPHLRQVFLEEKKKLVFYCGGDKTFSTTENRLLLPTSGRTPYNSSKTSFQTVKHYGQRKLLMSEIEFLTNVIATAAHSTDSQNLLVIYAGAAPGSHTNYLSLMFPQLRFIFFDHSEFLAEESDHIKIRREMFTNELAEEYSTIKENLLFICDIRQLYFQAWAPPRSTECRLLVTQDDISKPLIEYDNTDYDSAMFYFSTCTRTMYYEHDYNKGEHIGLDHCYDCRTELFILEQYVRKIKQVKEDEVKKQVLKLSSDIWDKITSNKQVPSRKR
ncbi:unnamed protein product, partial [Didymodactylos carnosus]